jgi:hypothetical protein
MEQIYIDKETHLFYYEKIIPKQNFEFCSVSIVKKSWFIVLFLYLFALYKF